MSELAQLGKRMHEQFGLSRGIVLAVGTGCVLLGIISMALPQTLFGSILRLTGFLLLISGGIKALQLLIGKQSANTRKRSWPMIVLQVVIDVAMGLVLLRDWKGSAGIAAIAFGVLFIIEGMLLGYIGLRAPTIDGGKAMLLAGLLTLAIGLSIVFGIVSNPLRWAGILVGLRLSIFGGVLCWIALRALPGRRQVLYEPAELVPRAGELYAVYFGTAFHLGVFIGEGEVVHYLNDNHVYRVSWDKFLSGRVPAHWTYPDLPSEPLDRIIATALAEVGKTYPYNLLTFNCENFAIFCKSAGKTYTSIYAQVASSVHAVAANPMLGLIAEINTRAVEWLAFHFGGPAGKRLSLAIRRTGAAVTNWLLRSAASASGNSQPSEVSES